MPECSVCGREFPEGQLLRCYDCGKAYCPECAEKDPARLPKAQVSDLIGEAFPQVGRRRPAG